MNQTATKSEADRFQTLAESFDLKKPGIAPFDANLLDDQYSGASHGEKVTISFLLNVWNGSHNWKAEKFDAIDALSIWGEKQRSAFISWAESPFFP